MSRARASFRCDPNPRISRSRRWHGARALLLHRRRSIARLMLANYLGRDPEALWSSHQLNSLDVGIVLASTSSPSDTLSRKATGIGPVPAPKGESRWTHCSRAEGGGGAGWVVSPSWAGAARKPTGIGPSRGCRPGRSASRNRKGLASSSASEESSVTHQKLKLTPTDRPSPDRLSRPPPRFPRYVTSIGREISRVSSMSTPPLRPKPMPPFLYKTLGSPSIS